jgi:hypothetical protein
MIYHPTTANFVQKTLSSDLLASVTASAALNNVTSIQNKKGVMIIDRVDTNGNETPSKVEVIAFNGTSGSTVVTLTRGLAGTTDQVHAVGAIVEFGPDIVWAQGLIDSFEAEHNADGTHKVNLTAQHNTDGTHKLGVMGLSRSWVNVSDAGDMYIDFSQGSKFRVTLTPSGDRTFHATNASVGDAILLRIGYASTASFNLRVFSTNATISWADNTIPTFTKTVNKADIFGFVVLATTATLSRFDGIIVSQNHDL